MCDKNSAHNLRMDKMHRIVEELCDVEELKDVREDLKQEKCIEGEDKRIVHAKREEERESVDASESDSELDSSDDESEEEPGDVFDNFFDG